MFRTIIWFLYFWAYQLYAYPLLKKADSYLLEGDIRKRDELVERIVQSWSTSLLSLAGCKTSLEGSENLEIEGPVLFVANHQSNFDIPILLSAIKKPKGFIAKDSLEKMPLLNKWMKHINCVFMNRENVRQSAAAINQGIAILKSGYSMVIFPEGTRSLDGQLLEFKPGALKLATKPGVPIIPITISGSINMMRKGSLKIYPSSVKVIIHDPIMPSRFLDTDTALLAEEIKAIIGNSL